ncbi:DNA/RNA helicase domain-containing protein [Aristaeella lactis]|uniref:Uncharacterized protein n=1 Tax=Aristaeella lactis TaxID=3046383 RepID=A0AC61PHF4_9FIRM|nr:DNA/RNA helicase domain-containing protein [Aristaeella lactis]QUA53423.1 DUF2075 domain-containing protein [Aristaeella lactis]SMC35138.1 hypothetical protein SAMN06297397_0179 [Aristaeella lactis]
MINFDVKICDFPFDATSQSRIEQWKSGDKEYGTNWPVVYMIHNDDSKEAYIGETLNAGKRAAQHWQVEERKRLKTIHIMTDDTFNKSVILDLESFLIKYISADGRYKLQNGNTGLSNFDYYDRQGYEKEFEKIWECLKEKGIVDSGIADIENSDLYKYSPYKSLTKDQERVLKEILEHLMLCICKNEEKTVIVKGGAGTGKTILAVFLLKLLYDLKNDTYEDKDEEDSEVNIDKLHAIMKQRDLKIGFIVPQQSLRKTLKKVFRTMRGIPESMIMTPTEAAIAATDAPFDLLVCDEAHRLRRRVALSQYPAYDKVNKDLGLQKDATELDWIIRSSKMQILFYDSAQSVRPSDIPKGVFRKILDAQENKQNLQLTSQLRCLGGDDYIKYIHEVLEYEGFLTDIDRSITESAVLKESGTIWTAPHGNFKDYTLSFYDDVDEMMNEINRLNKRYDLCCAVAGYAWEWITKKEPKNTAKRDIDIGKGYIWNRTYTDWINSDRLPYEIGCIHTVQGYDLNYVGVIFGPEIYYDKTKKRIEVDKSKYKDSLGKAVGNDYEALRAYILNIYATLLTRGIRGAFVYVCDPDLREYLRPYFTE